MAFTIDNSKETATPRKPVLLAEVTFTDASVWRAATVACTYGGHAYEPALVEQNVANLAYLSEQGIDRIPSASLQIADPAGTIFAEWERGEERGFRGATLVLRFALLDLVTGEWSTDSLIPFIGICGQPTCNAEGMTVEAQSKLNLTVLQTNPAPICERCIWLNPATAQQRSEASDPNSRFYPCGETRDLGTAPPCAYTKQTCTQPARFSGVTWRAKAELEEAKNYLQGENVQFRNPDSSGRYSKYWPVWLGGTAWIDAIPLAPWADGNYCRTEVAVGIGEVDVLRVILNNVELSQGTSGDYRWHYVNNGARDGAHNTDVGYETGDPYGGLTVIQVLAPHVDFAPGSTPTVRILGRRGAGLSATVNIASVEASDGPILVHLGRPTEVTDPYDGALVKISGCSFGPANGTFIWRYAAVAGESRGTLEGTKATGTGTGGTVAYETTALGIGGSAPTSAVLQEAYKASRRFSTADMGDSWTAALNICKEAVPHTDGNGTETEQMRFTSALGLVEPRSVSDIVRGLRVSIGARVFIGPTGKLEISVEGPLAEQQPAPVPGSNYNTPVSSILRDGSSADGYIAYDFDQSNTWDVQSASSGGNSTTPNKVRFPFSDPSAEWAVSQFSAVDPEDVSRMDQETAGGLQCQPEAIGSYRHAFWLSQLALAKVLRGNPAGDTRGTEYWQWKSSFRGVRVEVGQIVRLYHPVKLPVAQLIRVTGVKPSKNFETITFVGHHHEDIWYQDTPASLANPERTFFHFTAPGDVSAAPTFAVQASPLDPTVAQVLGLEFAADDDNKSIKSGVFEFYYCDPTSPANELEADLTGAASVIDNLTTSGLTAGDYIQIGREILKIGTPGATTPVQRAQLGSTADTASAGDPIHVLKRLAVTVSLTGEFIGSTELASWLLEQALPDQRLAAVTGRVTNDYGDSATTAVCLTDTGDGLMLSTPAAPGSAATVYQITNGFSSPALTGNGTTGNPFQLPAESQIDQVVATTQAVYLLIPTAASMVGVSITVKVAAGSDESVWLRPQSGQQIEGSGSDYEIADPASVTITAIDATHWAITAIGGSLTAPPAADAPNVTYASAAAFYGLSSHTPVFGFSGTINLPTAHADYSHLKRIDLVAYGPASQIVPICSLYSSDFSGSTIAFKGGEIPQAGAAENWTLKALAINEDGVATASPASSVITVRAASVTSISTPREVPTSAQVDPVNRLVSILVGGIPVLNGNQVPQVVSYLVSEDNGSNWLWIGDEDITSVGQEITFRRLRPATAATWKLAMAAGYHGGDATKTIPDASLASLYPGVVRSAGFTVNGLSAPAANLISGLTYTAGAGGNWPYNRKNEESGYQDWYIQSLAVDLTAAAASDAGFVSIVVQDLDASGNPIGPKHKLKDKAIPQGGGVVEFGPLSGPYGSLAVPARSGAIGQVGIEVYLSSRKNQADNAWLDATTSTLQTSVGTAGVLKLTVAVGGALPPGAIPATRLDSATLDPSLVKDPVTGKPRINTDNLANMVLNGSFESGDLTGWKSFSGAATVEYAPIAGIQPSGLYRALLTAGSGGVSWLEEATRHSCKPGESFYAETYVQCQSASNVGDFVLVVFFTDAAGGNLGVAGQYVISSDHGGAWNRLSTTITAPANAALVYVVVYCQNETPGKLWYVDGVFLTRQVPTGDGTEPDGRGGVKWRPGAGLKIGTGGAAELKTGASIDVDGSGGAIVKDGTLSESIFVGGAQGADLSKWATDKTLHGYYYGLPTKTANVPNVIINTAENPMRVYDWSGGSWVVRKVQPGDLVAGAITALVSLTSPTVSGGSFTGSSFTCTNGSNSITINPTEFLKILGPSGFQAVLNWVSLLLSQGSYSFTATPFGIQARLAGVNQGYSITPTGISVTDSVGSVYNSVNALVSYAKPGGGSGFIQIAQGVVTSVT